MMMLMDDKMKTREKDQPFMLFESVGRADELKAFLTTEHVLKEGTESDKDKEMKGHAVQGRTWCVPGWQSTLSFRENDQH